jgi:predicted transcriptional regulator
MKRVLDNQTVRKIAAEAMVDERTVRKYLDGKPLKGSSLVPRIQAAMRKLKVK